ncbi:hypothetical protein GMRT_15326 [Giardia muris]|uniref:Uncharacterized protein n=1 Tax=Giardia muris TaxID=5742 RepID=A0A4Z1T6Z7_GIAMU|nr:hypothetical protein GMRT_15326 [Giardia muris]|eukprot:TNJ28907.1 hypothetical protein GMRT_15326 [Giardia muris]
MSESYSSSVDVSSSTRNEVIDAITTFVLGGLDLRDPSVTPQPMSRPSEPGPAKPLRAIRELSTPSSSYKPRLPPATTEGSKSFLFSSRPPRTSSDDTLRGKPAGSKIEADGADVPRSINQAGALSKHRRAASDKLIVYTEKAVSTRYYTSQKPPRSVDVTGPPPERVRQIAQKEIQTEVKTASTPVTRPTEAMTSVRDDAPTIVEKVAKRVRPPPLQKEIQTSAQPKQTVSIQSSSILDFEGPRHVSTPLQPLETLDPTPDYRFSIDDQPVITPQLPRSISNPEFPRAEVRQDPWAPLASSPPKSTATDPMRLNPKVEQQGVQSSNVMKSSQPLPACEPGEIWPGYDCQHPTDLYLMGRGIGAHDVSIDGGWSLDEAYPSFADGQLPLAVAHPGFLTAPNADYSIGECAPNGQLPDGDVVHNFHGGLYMGYGCASNNYQAAHNQGVVYYPPAQPVGYMNMQRYNEYWAARQANPGWEEAMDCARARYLHERQLPMASSQPYQHGW